MRTSRRAATLAAAVTVVVGAALACAGQAIGAPAVAATAQAPAGQSYLRLAHLSPDTPDVDVYVSSVADPARTFVVPAVGYGAVSPYRPVPPDAYVVSMRAAGSPAGSPPVISTTVDARPGAAYTVAGVGPSVGLGLSVLTDRLDIPAPGRATVRVINAAATAPSVDVGPLGGQSWARNVRFGTATPYADVPLGDWTLQVMAAERELARLPVKLGANSVYSVLLLDKGNGLIAELHTDSIGSAVVPVGAVETGMGGAQPSPGSAVLWVLVAAGSSGWVLHRSRSGRPGVR